MNPKPLISVIMPVFNAEKYLSEAISSVLAQTYPNLELICVNDASLDNSLAILLQTFGNKIKIVSNSENCGIGETRNKGIKIAQGQFLAFLDADDIWQPQKLETQMLEFERNSELEILFSYLRCFISPELPPEIKILRYCNGEPMPGYLAGTTLVKNESFKKVGLFNPKWKVGEFIDWLARARELGLHEDIIPDVLLLRRIHETNSGVNDRSFRNDYLRIIRESLARKKQK